MVEFERWYRRHTKFNKTGLGIDEWRKQRDRDYEIWKAALEWLENMVVHQSDGPSNPKDLMECIQEELRS